MLNGPASWLAVGMRRVLFMRMARRLSIEHGSGKQWSEHGQFPDSEISEHQRSNIRANRVEIDASSIS
jgi:hypothetical protein